LPKKPWITVFLLPEDFSLVFMATVGTDYKFLCAHIGGYGKNRDGGIFEHPVMGKKFEAGTLNDPHDKPLPGRDEPTPYELIAVKLFH
jgi:hypothetical protein